MARERNPQRPHRPHELGPRIFRRGRWYGADLRPWGGGRVTLRNPAAAGWPESGERTDDPEIARRWTWAYVDMLRDGKRRALLGYGPAPRLLGKARDAYLEHRMEAVSENTYGSDHTALLHLVEWFGEHERTDRITAERIQEMVDARLRAGYRESTIRTYLTSLSAFFEWLGGPNPVRRIKVPRMAQKDVHAWTDDEIEQLRKAADALDRDARDSRLLYRRALELGLATGARQQELFALEWRAFNPEQRTVRISEQLSRTAARRVPLKGKVARTALVLPSWWEWHDANGRGLVLPSTRGTPITSARQRVIITRILDRAGLSRPGVGFHSLRHTYARLFIEMGGRLEELQKSLGHRTIRTTERDYGHFHEDVAAKLARMRIYREEGPRLVR